MESFASSARLGQTVGDAGIELPAFMCTSGVTMSIHAVHVAAGNVQSCLTKGRVPLPYSLDLGMFRIIVAWFPAHSS